MGATGETTASASGHGRAPGMTGERVPFSARDSRGRLYARARHTRSATRHGKTACGETLTPTWRGPILADTDAHVTCGRCARILAKREAKRVSEFETRERNRARVLAFGIEEMELGVRAYNILKRAGIDTLGELRAFSARDANALADAGQTLGAPAAMQICDAQTRIASLLADADGRA